MNKACRKSTRITLFLARMTLFLTDDGRITLFLTRITLFLTHSGGQVRLLSTNLQQELGSAAMQLPKGSSFLHAEMTCSAQVPSLPPTRTIRPNRLTSNLGFAWTDPPKTSVCPSIRLICTSG